MPNCKIDLIQIFKLLENKFYCIIKIPDEFPEYAIGSDIDIFCYDINNIANIILQNTNQYISDKITIEIKDLNKQIYVDIKEYDKIHLRFDLYGELPNYKNVKIKPCLFSSIIEHATSKSILNNELTVKVPCLIDEIIIRYIEYHEWYAQRPDKIKHINYIEKMIDLEMVDTTLFFDKLHYYTELPMVTESTNNQTPLSRKLFKEIFRCIRFK
jgi:hypothetical protein